MVKQILLVALGGGAGSALRYLTSMYAAAHARGLFPLGTFAVNIAGCFLIGLLVGLSARGGIIGDDAKLLLITGFCGGYTTFSAFSLENVTLFHDGHYLTLTVYILASVLAGAVALCLGLLAARQIP
ncbi:MAG: fluoride efflux transporter CrcB [Odoribacteraceae bacterium]|jgi:CrcB protein|nr:fluoride efflux transporter CrcB [Odoribacteraceae bacterium]